MNHSTSATPSPNAQPGWAFPPARPRTIVLAGGTGQVGQILMRHFRARGDRVVLVGRGAPGPDAVQWDGKTLGPWQAAVDGADAVINLAGRTVNCRYTEENLRQMYDSRVDSTRVMGAAIAAARQPPPVWLQMSTATIYAHTFGAGNTEATGVLGGDEPDAPAYWRRSIEIAKAWEAALQEAATPATRKVALRTAMVMSPDRDGIFDVLSKLVRAGLGGPVGGGRQYVSWIADVDLIAAVELLLARPDVEGVVNLCAPNPLPQAAFMQALRAAWGAPFGLPATAWMAEIGAFFLRTDTELLLKSRRVLPQRLLELGMQFRLPSWPEAAAELVARSRPRKTPALPAPAAY